MVGGLKTLCYNQRFAKVLGFDATSDRFMLKFSSVAAPVKVKRRNISFPARCPHCKTEVTSSACYACGFGLKDSAGDYGEDSATVHYGDNASSLEVVAQSWLVNSKP